MSKSLSDISRQNNSARVSKFASSIIPPAPEQETPAVTTDPLPVAPSESMNEVIKQGEADFAEGRGTVVPIDQLRETAKAAEPAPVAKPSRKRSATLALDDIIGPKAPEEEVFGKMTRISEKHHELLREIAYKHRKPMNTILYNLLEALDQTYQREQQNNA